MSHNTYPGNNDDTFDRGRTFSKAEISEREDAIRDAYAYFSSMLHSEHGITETVPHISSDTETVGSLTTRTCRVESSDAKQYELQEITETNREPHIKLVRESYDKSSGQKTKESFVFTNGALAKKATRVTTSTGPGNEVSQESAPIQKDEIDALVFSLLQPVFISPEQVQTNVDESAEARVGTHSLKRILNLRKH